MKLPRRKFLHLVAYAAALPAIPRIASALDYPTRPVHIIVGFAAGSASDILGRLIGQRLSERLGQPFIIENRGGAGGSLGTEAAVRAPADGYTLVLVGSNDAVNATLYKLDYNLIRDVAPIAGIASGPLVLVVHPSFPAKTVPEFIAYAKANPGKINFGSAGIGSIAQMAGELFKIKAGVNLVHVPYRGLAPALTDLLGGQIQAIFSTTPPAIGYIKAGKLRGLAVTSAARSDALPDLPSISDFVPGYEATLVLGLGAPRNVPAEIAEQLNKETNVVLTDPAMKVRLANLGNEPLPITSADFGRLLSSETEKWAKVIRANHIKAT